MPSRIMVVLSFVIILSVWRPSANPEFFGFSYLRLGFIGIAGIVLFYFLISVRYKKLQGFNNYVLFCVVIGSAAIEIFLRSMPSIIPDKFLHLLPYEVGQRLAADRGLFTTNRIEGEGVNFTWKPKIKFKERPWLIIDENGFENDAPLGKKADVILIGASVIAATLTANNFADYIRRDGRSAYALALGGPYGPQQFLAAYRKLIIEKNIDHKWVFILVVMPNELQKAFATQNVISQGGNFRDLFGTASIPSGMIGKYTPWIVSIYNKLPLMAGPLVQNLFVGQSNQTIEVLFDYGKITLHKSQFRPRSSENGWPFFEKSIGEIISLAKQAKAKPIIIHYPLKPLMVLPYVKGNEAEKSYLAAYYQKSTTRLKKFASDRGADFFDMTPHLQEIVSKKQLMRGLGEYHLNQEGVEYMYGILKNLMVD